MFRPSFGVRIALLVSLAASCDSGDAPNSAPEAKALAPSPSATPTPDPAPAPTPPAPPTPPVVEPPAPAPPAAVAGTVVSPPLGGGTEAAAGVDRERYPDPQWFNDQLFATGKVVQKGHNAPDPDGLFASQMRVELPAGTTPQQCVDEASEKVGKHLLEFEAAEAGDDGRLTVRGKAERYTFTLVCGVVNGTSIASVNYRWTQ